MENDALLVYSREVEDAKTEGKPIVALESTIIAHGMPFPRNLETARALEEIVRKRGAAPATIAILDGRIRIGLAEKEMARLARGEGVAKVSRRDLPLVLARGGPGATTVAATMICASRAGIRVFATGGIGGVHRGGEHSMDVSADLMELAQTEIAVVCAGAKSVLDIGRTLEVLETQGVPVIGYATDAFPAFYTRDSGFPVDARMDRPDEVARMLALKWGGLGLKGGVLVVNPIPSEAALDADLIDGVIAAALEEAETKGLNGKAVTPFLLARVAALTGGESLRANIALVKHNAARAADIALALSQL